MNPKHLLALSLCACALVVGAAPTSASTTSPTVSCARAVSWNRAASLIGRVATVKGRVAGAFFASASNGSPTFLNLGVDYPSPRRFTIVIWGRDRKKFHSPENSYRGRTVCVRGLIRPYAGIAEVFASSPSQIVFA